MTRSAASGPELDQLSLIVERLVGLRASGVLSGRHVREAAAAAAVSERTMWRWVAQGRPVRRAGRATELTDIERLAYLATGGNVSAAHRALSSDGRVDVSERTLRRRLAAQLSPGERAFARDGVEGQRAYGVYLRWEPERRGQLYESDHKQLSIDVLAPRASRPQRPWATLVLDGYSRLIVGWAISLQPTQAEVLAALRAAVVEDPDRCFGGICDVLRVDGGLEFAAGAIRDACAGLGILLETTEPYSPWQKGKVERVNRTIDQTLLSLLPRYGEGPRAANGKLLDTREPLSLQAFCARFSDWVREYNERPHSGLDGQSPLDRWSEDAHPVRTLPQEQARWLLLAGAHRRVNKDGIHFGGITFIAPELHGLVGEQVEVRHMPHDRRQIEIYRDARWLATAYPQHELSEAQRAAVVQTRREQLTQLKRDLRRARGVTRRRLAPITDGSAPIDELAPAQPRAVPRAEPAALRLLDLGQRVDTEPRSAS